MVVVAGNKPTLHVRKEAGFSQLARGHVVETDGAETPPQAHRPRRGFLPLPATEAPVSPAALPWEGAGSQPWEEARPCPPSVWGRGGRPQRQARPQTQTPEPLPRRSAPEGHGQQNRNPPPGKSPHSGARRERTSASGRPLTRDIKRFLQSPSRSTLILPIHHFIFL